MITKFAPISQGNLQIGELDPNFVLSHVPDEIGVKLFNFDINGKKYNVNLGNSRYVVFKKSLICQCCGVVGNRCFLDKDLQSTQETGRACYHINFYAENTRDDTRHMVLMSRDHIVPRSLNGNDEIDNLQTLCFNCNSLKGSLQLSNELMRSILFPAYRAFQASHAINQTRKSTLNFRQKIKRNFISIDKLNEACAKVTQSKVPELLEKIERLKEEISFLTKKCDEIELQSQVSGLILNAEDFIK